jgi:uncharacterized cupredoxin-like copper-binding protein
MGSLGRTPLLGRDGHGDTGRVNTVTIRRAGVVIATAAVLAAAGCASGNRTRPSGPGMMGSAQDYQYSRLTCAAPADLPGQVVTVMLADMGMHQVMGGVAPLGVHMMLRAAPVTITSGKVSFVAQNMGWRTHELVILPLAPGAAAGQRTPGPDGKIDETGSLGEASANCAAGSGDGIPSGAVSWVTLTLPPGSYELVCNLANHYVDGMRQQVTVT